LSAAVVIWVLITSNIPQRLGKKPNKIQTGFALARTPMGPGKIGGLNADPHFAEAETIQGMRIGILSRKRKQRAQKKSSRGDAEARRENIKKNQLNLHFLPPNTPNTRKNLGFFGVMLSILSIIP
jgi:hypothetical protein